MSEKKKGEKKAPPTVITLTLPENEGDEAKGTLLIQRGDLAHVRKFAYSQLGDITLVIAEAMDALTALELNPPIIPETKVSTPVKAASKAETPTEPTIDIPLKKGKKAVKISHLKITSGETDTAAYDQAIQIAGKLIDGGLWDGETPIRIDDVYTVQRKLKGLTDKELSLFSLGDFVQVGGPDESEATVEATNPVEESVAVQS